MATPVTRKLTGEEYVALRSNLTPEQRAAVRDGRANLLDFATDETIKGSLERRREAEAKAKEASESTKAYVETTSVGPPEDTPSLGQAALANLLSLYESSVGSAAFTLADTEAGRAVAGAVAAPFQIADPEGLQALSQRIQQGQTAQQATESVAAESLAGTAETRLAEAERQGAIAQRYTEAPTTGVLGRGVVDVAGSLDSGIPLATTAVGALVGGPAGAVVGNRAGAAIPATNLFTRVYAEARRKGLTQEEAAEQAGIQAAIEYGTEALTGPLNGILGKKIGAKVLNTIAQKVASGAGRVARSAAAEGLQEGATSVIGDVATLAQLEAGGGSEAERAYLEATAPASLEDVAARAGRAAVAGAMMGGPIRATTVIPEIVQQSREAQVAAQGVAAQQEIERAAQAEFATQEAAREGARQAAIQAESEASAVRSQEALQYNTQATQPDLIPEREPTSVDMFSGQEVPAETVEARRAATTVEAPREETESDYEFELRKEREFQARTQITDRTRQNREEVRREDAFLADKLRNRKTYLSRSSVNEEARIRLEPELAQVRESFEGIPQRQIEAEVAKVRKARLPELMEEVRQSRQEVIRRAEDRENAIQEGFEARKQAEEVARQPAPPAPQPEPVGQPDLFNQTEQATLAMESGQQELPLNVPDQTPAPVVPPAPLSPEETQLASQVRTQRAEAYQKSVDNYQRRETRTRQKFIRDEIAATPNATPEIIARRVNTKMQTWRVVNPAPAQPTFSEPVSLATGRSATQIEQTARQVAARAEATSRATQTRRENQRIAQEVRRGATPEEVAERIVSPVVEDTDVALTPTENAEARSRLAEAAGIATPELPAAVANQETPSSTRPQQQVDIGAGRQVSVRTDVKDTIEETVSEGSNAAGALEALLDLPGIDEDQKWLAGRLVPLLRVLQVQLTYGPTAQGYLGTYSPTTNTIHIAAPRMSTMLHESLHAVTANLLRRRNQPGAPMRIKQLADELEDLRAHLQVASQDAPAIMAPYFTSPVGPLSNIDELLTYGFTDQGFATWLASVPAPPSKRTLRDALSAFADMILSFFNVPRDRRTALTELIAIGDDLLSFIEQNPGVTREATRATLASNIPVPEQPSGIIEDTVQDARRVVETARRTIPDYARYARDTLVAALTPTAGLGEELKERIERSQSVASGYVYTANAMFNAFNSGVAAEAKRTGKSPESTEALIEKKIANIESIKDPKMRETALNALVREHPEAGAAYRDFRNEIDQLSRDIIKERLADPTPLTKAEERIYTSIAENMGRYYTRTYASKSKAIRKKYSKQLVSNWQSYANNPEQFPEYKEEFTKVENAIKFLEDNELTIPDEDTLYSLSIDRLRDYYSVWGRGNPGAMTAEGIIDHLNNIRESVTPEQIRNQAVGGVTALLGLTNTGSRVINYYRGNKQDRGIVMARENVPEPLRKLMGEYENPALKALVTVAAQGEFIARTKLLNEIMQNEVGRNVIPAEQGGLPGNERFTEVLSGAGYGALNGYRATPRMRQAIDQTMEVYADFNKAVADMAERPIDAINHFVRAGAGIYMKAAAWQKFLNIVLNPANVALNFFGSPLITAVQGGIAPSNLTKGLDAAMRVIRSGTRNELDPLVQELTRAGLRDSAVAGELQESEIDKLRDIMVNFQDRATTRVARRGARAAGLWTKETYANADVWVKYANYFQNKDLLTEYYGLTGEQRTPEQIEREAAARTNQTNITYKRVPGLIKLTEKAGLTQFATYIAEVMRMPVANARVAIQDWQRADSTENPEAANLMRMAAARRMAGTAAVFLGVPLLTNMAAKSLDDDDDETRKKKLNLLPEYARNQDLFPIGRDAKGNEVYYGLERVDPVGPATSFVRLAANGGTADEFKDAIYNLVFAPRIGTALLESALGDNTGRSQLQDMAPGLYEVITRALDKTTPMGPEGANELVRTLETATPGMVKRWSDTNPTVEGEGQTITTLMKAMGFQFFSANPKNAMTGAAIGVSEIRDANRKELAQFMKNEPEASPERVLDKLTELQDQEVRAFRQLSGVLDGLKVLEDDKGRQRFSNSQIWEMAKAARVDAVDFRQAWNHQFESRLITERSANALLTKLYKNKTVEEQREIYDHLMTVMKLQKESQRNGN